MDGTIRIWNMNNLTELPVMLIGHTDLIFSVCATSDGSRIVSGVQDGTIRVWNMNNLNEPASYAYRPYRLGLLRSV